MNAFTFQGISVMVGRLSQFNFLVFKGSMELCIGGHLGSGFLIAWRGEIILTVSSAQLLYSKVA